VSTLVIVESPTKARTIRRFLPPGYVVLASMGHVRDLPSSASEIPKSARDKPWSRLGVDVDGGFKPLYVVPRKSRETIKELKAALKEADELIIATDEDREGESIGWHLIQILKPKVPIRRMVFHEITREAIQRALEQTRTVDEQLVRAQETRRILDRLVGYTLSPLLWKKIAPKLSAGRVQSVAVRMLVERERERRAFVIGSFWDLAALLAKRPDRADHRFEATLVRLGDRRVATGRDFDENTGQVRVGAEVVLLDQEAAEALRERLQVSPWRVAAIEAKKAVRRPYPPFTTSTLQQEAARKLRLSARQTMRVAQQLYENGHITYHRTDSVSMAEEAVQGARTRITALYGAEYLSPKPRRFKTKSRGAQEAHEAIRPTGGEMRPVREIPLSGQQARLYDLIWKRTMATQMADARLELATVDIAAEDALFRAKGRRVLFPGFFRVYVEGSDNPEAVLEDRDAPLPELAEGEELDLVTLDTVSHETKPPARYTEAALIKALEAAGIGRPSTYATIMGTIQDRGYVFKRDRALVPTFTAFAVTGLLESDFESLVDLSFTASMEADLDRIAEGEVDWQAYLGRLYLGEEGLAARVGAAAERIDPRQASTVNMGDVMVRIGRYGPFVEGTSNGDRVTAGLPGDLPPAELTAEQAADMLSRGKAGPTALGTDPDTGDQVYLKAGPYGPYVQRGEDGKGKDKPARASLAPGLEPEDVDLGVALSLLALPRPLGDHPETGTPVKAGLGRYGPYVLHDGVYASLSKSDDVLTVELERALVLLAAKKARGKRRKGGGGKKGRRSKKSGGSD